MTTCDDLAPFADGELDPAGAELVRAHLGHCAPCQSELLLHMQLSTRLSTLRPSPAMRASMLPPRRHVASPALRWQSRAS